jgi:hypothetical protein
MAAGNNRVLTKDLDTRLKSVEDRLHEFAVMLKRLEEQAGHAQAEAQAAANRIAEAEAAVNRVAEAQAGTHQSVSNGNSNGNGAGDAEDKLIRLEAVVGRLDDRVGRSPIRSSSRPIALADSISRQRGADFRILRPSPLPMRTDPACVNPLTTPSVSGQPTLR